MAIGSTEEFRRSAPCERWGAQAHARCHGHPPKSTESVRRHGGDRATDVRGVAANHVVRDWLHHRCTGDV